MHTKRILSTALAVLMLLPTLAACGSAPSPSAETTVPTASTTATPETSAPTHDNADFLLDDLPTDLKFNGETVTFLYWEDVEKPEFFVKEITGEIVNDAIFNRNETVERRLDVKLNWLGTPGASGKQSAYLAQAQNLVNSGEPIDIFAAYSGTGATVAANDLAMNLLELKHLNFDQPWWPTSLIDTATVNNKLLFASGDISTMMLHMMYCIFVNRDMLKAYQLDDPYTLVENGTWTMDRLIAMTAGIYTDLDGTNTVTANDRVGLATHIIHSDAWFTAAGLKTVESDASGKLTISPLFLGERTISLLEKINAFYHDTNAVSINDTNTFRDGNALFALDRAYMAENKLRDVTFDYGVVPVPKMDEGQEGYGTCMGFPLTLYLVSKSSAAPDMASAVLECMASESYRQVTPMLYENGMKIKYSTNDTASKMYDIIRSSVVIDIGRVYADSLNKLTWNIFRNSVENNNNSLASQAKIYEKQLNSLLGKLQNIYD